MGTKVCCVCGKIGHFARTYPNNPNLEGEKKTLAKIITTTKAKAKANPSVVTGKLSITKISIFIFFYLGATRSFTSTKYVRRLCRVPDLAKISYNMRIHFGDSKPTNKILELVSSLLQIENCMLI